MQSTSTLDSPDGMGMLPQEAHGAEPSGRRMSITDPPVTWAEKVPTAGVKSVSREVVKVVAMVASVIVRWRHCPTRTDPHVHMRIGRHNDKGPRGAGLVVSILTGSGSDTLDPLVLVKRHDADGPGAMQRAKPCDGRIQFRLVWHNRAAEAAENVDIMPAGDCGIYLRLH